MPLDALSDLDDLSAEELTDRLFPLLQPGLVLRKIFMRYFGLDAVALAEILRVEAAEIEDLLQGSSVMTPEMALRLGRCFRTEPYLWMNLQIDHDFWQVRHSKGDEIDQIEPIR